MNRTVAYQETNNNFDDVRQTIKSAQIATIKNFGVAPPAGAGDFVGQLGISADANGEALLYVSAVGGTWQLVGKSGHANIPDEVVMEDRKNNFTEKDQRIEDCQITYLDSGTALPATVAVKGAGHCYVYESTPPRFYMSFDGHSFTQIQTENDMSDGDVKTDQPNDFTNGDQTIQGYSIANIIKSSLTPQAANITPTRNGELYIQVAEGTADKRARMWISSNTGSWKWEALTHLFDLPVTVAKTDQANDFQVTEQLLSGKQIMSFIDGGEQTPEQSKAIPDYDGQCYVAVHTRVGGQKDVAIWIAKGNQWLPIQQDIELSSIVRDNKSNRFAVPEQILGEGGPNARWLIGARVKFSGNSPIADNNWRVQNIGEITVYENNSAIPRELSIWMGVAKNPSTTSNLNEWALVWSNNQGDVANIAHTNQRNEFIPLQYINNGGKKSLITSGHEGGAGSPHNHLIPCAPGDTYTQSYSHPGLGETRNIWMAAIEADTTSWKRMLCADDKDAVLTNQSNHFTDRDQFLGAETSTKRDRIMGARNHESSTSGIIGISPTAFGEVVVTKKWDPAFPSDADKMIVEAHIAVGTGRKSWIKIGEAVAKDLEIIDDGTNN